MEVGRTEMGWEMGMSLRRGGEGLGEVVILKAWLKMRVVVYEASCGCIRD